MRSRIKNIIFFILLSIAGWLILKKAIIPSFRNVFKEKAVVIDETPILIKNIRSIGQLVTYSAYDEVVVDSLVVTSGSMLANSINRVSVIPVLPVTRKELVLIGKGQVTAGVDLTLLAENSLSVIEDTVRIDLPPAKILDVIINPSGFETFQEIGRWTTEEVALVKLKAKQKITDRAIQRNIISLADAKAKAVIENFLLNLGYKKVEVY
jgi:hypothetical protein